MLSITITTSDNLIEVTVSNKLQTRDFKELADHVDALIKKYGNIRILINAMAFDGWESVKAAEEHFCFVKKHHKDVERIAVIASHSWQHWLVAMARVFVHPKIEVFDVDQITKAKEWIKNDE
ncbi:STAS/SEC14 domain-containing protein [Rickettsiales bacterium]|nr:STAS/SEC14 domain-containing protein [Rickettsiales bacterium]